MKLLIKCMAMLMAVTLFSCGRGSNSPSSLNRNEKMEDKSEVSKDIAGSSTADSTTVQKNTSGVVFNS